jgi:hypothetical protein
MYDQHVVTESVVEPGPDALREVIRISMNALPKEVPTGIRRLRGSANVVCSNMVRT